jgi:cell division protein FtsB
MKRVLVRDLIYRSLLGAMTLFFLYSIMWSDVGFVKYFSIKREIVAKRAEVAELSLQRDELKGRIEAWQRSPFYLEKVAREELGMGNRKEIVYLY